MDQTTAKARKDPGPLRLELHTDPAIFRGALIGTGLSILGGLVLLLIGVAGLSRPEKMESLSTIFILAVGMIFFFGGFKLLWERNLERRRRIQIHQDGLVYVPPGEARIVCRWDEIDAVLWHEEIYALVRSDGLRFTLSQLHFTKEDIEQLGKILRRETQKLPQPPIWQRFESEGSEDTD